MSVTLKKNHAKVKRMMREDVAAGENKAVQFLVTEAQAGAPVKSGNLRRLIQQVVTASPGNPQAEAKSGATYSVPVNQGTHNMAGTFFWTRAVNQMQSRFGRFFKKR